MTGEGAHGKSNSPKTQRLLQALGTPIHALTVRCVAILSLLLLALAMHSNSMGNSAPRIVLKPYLDLRAVNVSAPDIGHSDWLREVPEHPESASERLARRPHDLKPGNAAQSLSQCQLCPAKAQSSKPRESALDSISPYSSENRLRRMTCTQCTRAGDWAPMCLC